MAPPSSVQGFPGADGLGDNSTLLECLEYHAVVHLYAKSSLVQRRHMSLRGVFNAVTGWLFAGI